MAVLQKTKNRINKWYSNSMSGHTIWKELKAGTRRGIYTPVCVHSSQKMEATQAFTDGWIDKQNVAYTYNRILFSLKKEGDSDRCYNMDQSWGHYTKWNKPVTKGQILHDSIYMSTSVQFSSVAQSCPTLCDPMNHSTPGLPVHHQLPEFTQTHVHRVSDAIQPSHPLLSPSPPAPNPSQHQGLFQWVNSSHEVVKVLEFQL